jgi:hypothetical protein
LNIFFSLSNSSRFVRHHNGSKNTRRLPASKTKIMKKTLAILFAAFCVFSIPMVKGQETWKLIWYDHFRRNQLFEVLKTDVSKADVNNSVFNSWCVPIARNNFNILEQVLIAKDEQWQVSPAFLTDHGLPMLNERWFQIMDDERWYAVRVTPR